jgi:Transglycosylase-like domain
MPAITLIGLLALFPTNSALLTVPIAQAAQITPQQAFTHALEQCENNQWPELRRIVDTNGYYSYGPLMFQMGTWLSYGAPFGTTHDNIYDQDLQEEVATSMLDHGGWRHWQTCYLRIKAKLGDWPK